jgi:hypothetical protein
MQRTSIDKHQINNMIVDVRHRIRHSKIINKKNSNFTHSLIDTIPFLKNVLVIIIINFLKFTLLRVDQFFEPWAGFINLFTYWLPKRIFILFDMILKITNWVIWYVNKYRLNKWQFEYMTIMCFFQFSIFFFLHLINSCSNLKFQQQWPRN